MVDSKICYLLTNNFNNQTVSLDMNTTSNKCIMSDRTAPFLWRFVKSSLNNSLGLPQYYIRACNSDHVLSWNHDDQRDNERKYVMGKIANAIAKNNETKSLWVLIPIVQPDGSVLYEIVDAQSTVHSLYAAQLSEHNEQLALVWTHYGFDDWTGNENNKRLWKLEPINGLFRF